MNHQPLNVDGLDEAEVQDPSTLQTKWLSPLLLDLASPNGRYKWDTDGCDKKYGCILLQSQPDKQHAGY